MCLVTYAQASQVAGILMSNTCKTTAQRKMKIRTVLVDMIIQFLRIMQCMPSDILDDGNHCEEGEHTMLACTRRISSSLLQQRPGLCRRRTHEQDALAPGRLLR